MIQTPPSAAGIAVWHQLLTRDQCPATGGVRGHLPAREQVRMSLEERLQDVFRGVGSLVHRRQSAVAVDVEQTVFAHRGRSYSLRRTNARSPPPSIATSLRTT